MAKNTKVTITDDMDGSEGASEYSFSLNGTQYTIDLGEKNAAKLDKALAPFINKATKVSSSRKKASAGKRTDLSDVRNWARQNGHDVSERGRVPQTVLDAYNAK